MLNEDQVVNLRKTLKEKRRYGVLHFDLQAKEKFKKEDVKTTIDAYMTSFNFASLGEHWIATDKYRVDEIITELLYRDQAYSVEIMPLHEAKALSKDILGLFNEPLESYTNDDDDGEWMPVTGATFDRGVVILDEKLIGLFWIQDED